MIQSGYTPHSDFPLWGKNSALSGLAGKRSLAALRSSKYNPLFSGKMQQLYNAPHLSGKIPQFYNASHLSGKIPQLYNAPLSSERMPDSQPSSEKGHKVWGEEVYPLLSWFETQRVKEAHVMVVGAGALGNEVLKNLALFGVGHIVIVDFDTIEYSNLTRSVLFRPEDADKGLYKAEVAARRIKEINPAIHVQTVCGDLATGTGLGLYRKMDVIIGCLDSLEARIMLNRICFRAGKSWIDGGIGDLEGQVTVYQPGENCYECNLTDDERRDVSGRMPCAGIVKMNEEAGRTATTPVSASIIAAVQVQEAMKLLHPEAIEAGKFSPLTGKLFAYEGAHPSVSIFEFAPNDKDCIAHEFWDPVIQLPGLSADTTVAEALGGMQLRRGESGFATGNVASSGKVASPVEITSPVEMATPGNMATPQGNCDFAGKIPPIEIHLRNNKFVDRIVSRESNKRFYPMLPASQIPDYIMSSEELRDIQLSEGFYQHDFENINDTFPYPQLTLRQIGIPDMDVIPVSTPQGLFYVELL